MLALLPVLAFGVLLYLIVRGIMCKSATEYAGFTVYLPLVKAHAAQNGIDWRLVAAHITVESSWNSRAVNVHDYGLGQIHCTPDGKGGCANHFDIPIWAEVTQEKLFDPDVNIEAMCEIIAWNQKTFGLIRGIAVYNNWGYHKGPISDLTYTESVLCVLAKLQGEFPNG